MAEQVVGPCSSPAECHPATAMDADAPLASWESSLIVFPAMGMALVVFCPLGAPAPAKASPARSACLVPHGLIIAARPSFTARARMGSCFPFRTKHQPLPKEWLRYVTLAPSNPST